MERKYWMHRISLDRDIKQGLLDHDHLLATGWGNIASDSFLYQIKGKNRADFCALYESVFGNLTRNRYCLFMFLNEFKKGDYVIVPGIKDFSVYEIDGEEPISKEHICDYTNNINIAFVNDKCCNKSGKELDLGFFWIVKPILLNIERNGFASNKLQRRLKFQMTNIGLTDLSADIEEAIKAKANGKTINLKDEIENETSSIILNKLLSRINDSGFEKVVKWYLNRLGATSTFIPAKRNLSTRQGDADVIALFDELRVALFVQVKQYDNQVEKSALEQVVHAYESYREEYVAYTPILWIVTTCKSFSQEAQDYANENNVRCIDGDEFARMILEIGINDLNI